MISNMKNAAIVLGALFVLAAEAESGDSVGVDASQLQQKVTLSRTQTQSRMQQKKVFGLLDRARATFGPRDPTQKLKLEVERLQGEAQRQRIWILEREESDVQQVQAGVVRMRKALAETEAELAAVYEELGKEYVQQRITRLNQEVEKRENDWGNRFFTGPDAEENRAVLPSKKAELAHLQAAGERIIAAELVLKVGRLQWETQELRRIIETNEASPNPKDQNSAVIRRKTELTQKEAELAAALKQLRVEATKGLEAVGTHREAFFKKVATTYTEEGQESHIAKLLKGKPAGVNFRDLSGSELVVFLKRIANGVNDPDSKLVYDIAYNGLLKIAEELRAAEERVEVLGSLLLSHENTADKIAVLENEVQDKSEEVAQLVDVIKKLERSVFPETDNSAEYETFLKMSGADQVADLESEEWTETSETEGRVMDFLKIRSASLAKTEAELHAAYDELKREAVGVQQEEQAELQLEDTHPVFNEKLARSVPGAASPNSVLEAVGVTPAAAQPTETSTLDAESMSPEAAAWQELLKAKMADMQGQPSWTGFRTSLYTKFLLLKNHSENKYKGSVFAAALTEDVEKAMRDLLLAGRVTVEVPQANEAVRQVAKFNNKTLASFAEYAAEQSDAVQQVLGEVVDRYDAENDRELIDKLEHTRQKVLERARAAANQAENEDDTKEQPEGGALTTAGDAPASVDVTKPRRRSWMQMMQPRKVVPAALATIVAIGAHQAHKHDGSLSNALQAHSPVDVGADAGPLVSSLATLGSMAADSWGDLRVSGADAVAGLHRLAGAAAGSTKGGVDDLLGDDEQIERAFAAHVDSVAGTVYDAAGNAISAGSTNVMEGVNAVASAAAGKLSGAYNSGLDAVSKSKFAQGYTDERNGVSRFNRGVSRFSYRGQNPITRHAQPDYNTPATLDPAAERGRQVGQAVNAAAGATKSAKAALNDLIWNHGTRVREFYGGVVAWVTKAARQVGATTEGVIEAVRAYDQSMRVADKEQLDAYFAAQAELWQIINPYTGRGVQSKEEREQVEKEEADAKAAEAAKAREKQMLQHIVDPATGKGLESMEQLRDLAAKQGWYTKTVAEMLHKWFVDMTQGGGIDDVSKPQQQQEQAWAAAEPETHEAGAASTSTKDVPKHVKMSHSASWPSVWAQEMLNQIINPKTRLGVESWDELLDVAQAQKWDSKTMGDKLSKWAKDVEAFWSWQRTVQEAKRQELAVSTILNSSSAAPATSASMSVQPVTMQPAVEPEDFLTDADGMPTANNLKARGHSPSTVTLAQTSILSHDDMIKRMWDAKTMGDKLADKALEAEREKQELAGKAVSTILNSSSAATSESMSVPPVTITIDVNGTRVGVPADDLEALGLVLYQPQGQAEGQPAATSFPSQKDMVDAFYRDIETKAANERAARRAEIKAELEEQNQAGTAAPAVVSTDSSEPSAPAPTNKEPQMVITLNGKERLVPVGDVLAAFAKLQAKSTAPWSWTSSTEQSPSPSADEMVTIDFNGTSMEVPAFMASYQPDASWSWWTDNAEDPSWVLGQPQLPSGVTIDGNTVTISEDTHVSADDFLKK